MHRQWCKPGCRKHAGTWKGSVANHVHAAYVCVRSTAKASNNPETAVAECITKPINANGSGSEANGSCSRRGLLAGTVSAATLVFDASSNSTTAGAAPVATSTSPALPQCQTASSAVGVSEALQGSELQQGVNALRNPFVNRGLATPVAARDAFQLQALLPAGTSDVDVEILRARAALNRACDPLAKYQVLMTLAETNAQALYTLLQENVQELLPLVYTPTVGDACLGWGTLLPRPTGLYISYARHRGRVKELVKSWPYRQLSGMHWRIRNSQPCNIFQSVQRVRIAVITDGQRILGLGACIVAMGVIQEFQSAAIPPIQCLGDWLRLQKV